MTQQSRMRRMGWLAVLSLCTVFYLALHLKVHAVQSEVVRSERQIIALESEKALLETEFETRANQEQLASWNRIDFGYTAPGADQFVENERQLAQFGTPRAAGAPAPILVAAITEGDKAPPFAKFVSPLGRPVDARLIDANAGRDEAVDRRSATISIPLAAAIGNVRE
jgi:cell division protein FtsB